MKWDEMKKDEMGKDELGTSPGQWGPKGILSGIKLPSGDPWGRLKVTKCLLLTTLTL